MVRNRPSRRAVNGVALERHFAAIDFIDGINSDPMKMRRVSALHVAVEYNRISGHLSRRERGNDLAGPSEIDDLGRLRDPKG